MEFEMEWKQKQKGNRNKTETKFNSFGPISYIHLETFRFTMSIGTISLFFGDMFCFSRKGRIGGGGWVHPKYANSMAESGLSIETTFQRSRPIFQLQQVGISVESR